MNHRLTIGDWRRPTTRSRVGALLWAATLAAAVVSTTLVAGPAAAHSSHEVHYHADELPTVVEVRIDGNDRVEDAAISANVHQRAGSALDEAQVDRDIHDIYAMGFFANVWVTVDPVPGGVVATYHVRERPYVAEIEFLGVEEVEVADLEAVVGVRPRTIFDPKKAWEGIAAAKEVYAGEGYPDASLHYSLQTDEATNEAVLTYFVDEKEQVRIHDIYFEGVTAFPERKLRGVMATREDWIFGWITGAGILNEEELATDVERLTAFYYDAGHIMVKVDEPEVVRDEDGLAVTVRIEEGPQFTLGSVDFEGDVYQDEKELLYASGLEPGEIFQPSSLRDAIFGLTEAYGNLGYAFAEVVPLTDTRVEDRKVDVRFRARSGPIVTVRRIDVRGNTKTRDYVIRREMRLQEGEMFSGTGLRGSRDRIRRLGHFDEVDITSNRTEEEDKVDLVVNVAEGRTGSFSAGAGFSSEDAFLANARITERNLFGRGQLLNLGVDFGTRRQNFRVGLTEPWFMDIPLSLGVDLFAWQFEFGRFTRGGTGGSIRASYPLWELGLRELWGIDLDTVRVGLEYRLEQAEISGVDRFAPPAVYEEEGTRLTSSLRPSISRNTIDQPFDPTEGSRQSMSFEFSGLGGDTDFIKLEISGRWYWPVYETKAGNRIVFSMAGDLGYGLGDSGESGKELPLFERYFPGGINSNRGYQVRSLGPRQIVIERTNGQDCLRTTKGACDLDEIGASQQLMFNNELIFPVVPDAGLKMALFLDVGEGFLADDGIDLLKLRPATGAEVRWLSPLGPVRVSAGFPLDRREDDDSFVILFSFGTPF